MPGPVPPSAVDTYGDGGPDAATDEPGPVGQHRAAHEVGAGAAHEQRDVGAEAPTDDGDGSELGQRRVGVGHQRLGGVATSRGDGGAPVPGEVEGMDRAGPRRRPARGPAAGDCSPETVQQQERTSLPRRAGGAAPARRGRGAASSGRRRRRVTRGSPRRDRPPTAAARCARSGRRPRAARTPRPAGGRA